MNISLRDSIPGYFLGGLVVGAATFWAGGASTLIAATLGLLTAGTAFAHKYYKSYQFDRLSYPLSFKSMEASDILTDKVDDQLNAYKLGQDAYKSWGGYFTSYTKPEAYIHYNEFCTGQIEADGEINKRRVTI